MIEFERVYFENAESVFRFIFNMCGNSKLAEEITEDTFRRAFSSMYRYNGKIKFRTWLSAVALKSFLSYFKKASSDGIDAGEPSGREAGLRKAILSMPDMYRDTLILRLYAGISFPEIAALMRISSNSSKVIYCRAKKILSKVV